MQHKTKNFIIIITLVISIILLNSCGVNRVIGEKKSHIVTYDSIDFQLSKIKRLGSINNYGGGTFTHVKKGKFYIVTLEAKNNSSKRKKINLREIILCDSSKQCLRVGRIDYNTVIDWPSKDTMTLYSNNKDGRHLFYAGPRDFIPKYLVIKNKENVYIQFEYKKD